MNDEDSKKVIKLLEEVLKWQKFQGFVRLKEVLLANIKTDKEKIIYELSNGLSTKEIASKSMVSHVTVYNYWQKWSKLGIVEPSKKYKGRYERMISLEDIGIEVPKIQEDSKIISSTPTENNETEDGEQTTD